MSQHHHYYDPIIFIVMTTLLASSLLRHVGWRFSHHCNFMCPGHPSKLGGGGKNTVVVWRHAESCVHRVVRLMIEWISILLYSNISSIFVISVMVWTASARCNYPISLSVMVVGWLWSDTTLFFSSPIYIRGRGERGRLPLWFLPDILGYFQVWSQFHLYTIILGKCQPTELFFPP